MEALCIQTRDGEVRGLTMDEMEQAKNLVDHLSTSSTDEEDEESQPPLLIRRKVSFADAFGLNLVSVKEFDNVETAGLESAVPSDREEAIPSEDVHMCCLFTVPPSPEELEEKVQEQMLELESIELLPKTTTLRGTVRVLNLCYKKLVYVRLTLDRWRSHFDLLAEYVPGSSDRKTDRFTFQYTLVPPFDKEGTRLEFCLCYETSVGTFWANNNNMNYVLFCHQKVKDNGPQMQEESNGKIKKSCLKAIRRESAAEELIKEALVTAAYATESKDTCKSEVSHENHRTGAQSSLNIEENKHTVDSIKSRHRAARLARAQEPCPQRRQRVPPNYSHDLPQLQKGSQPIPSAGCNLSGALHESNNAQVLTYHQIPLAALDWSSDKPSGADETWTERAKRALSESHKESSVNDLAAVTSMWEAFVNRAEEEETTSKEAHVLDAWQVFINASDGETRSPESERMQAATPSNNEDPSPLPPPASCQVRPGQNTPMPEASPANTDVQEEAVALARVTNLGDDNPGRTPDAPQRSEWNSGRGSAWECSLAGARPASKASADSPSERREHEIWEREEGAGIMGTRGGDEPFTRRPADLVTSSGESETTDMTAMPESPNASAGDSISGLQQGLSYSRDGKVTATAYNTADDTLAFKETMRQGTADGERFVFSAQEGLTTKCAGNKAAKKEEIVRPREREKCQVSRGGGGGGGGFFSSECDSLERCEESEASTLDGSGSVRNSGDYLQRLRKGRNSGKQVFSPENGAGDKNGHKAEIGAECKINGDEWPHKNSDSREALARRHNENTAMFPEINISQTKPQPMGEKRNDKDEIPGASATRIETNVTGDRVFQTGKDCCEIMQGRQKPREEIPPSMVTKEEPFSTTQRTSETETIYQSDTSRSLPDPEVEEISWTHSHSVHKEDAGCRMSSEEVVLKEKETSAALQPETLEGMEEDISRGDGDERPRIGKLKIEARGKGEWAGSAENPGEGKLKEQELSAEVESSPRVECQKLSERRKNPIRDDGVEREMLLEGFGREAARTVWGEVFDCQYGARGPGSQAGGGEEGHRASAVMTRYEKCKETLPTDCVEGQPLDERDEETHSTANTNTSGRLRNDPHCTSGSQTDPSSTPSIWSSLTQESIETKHRSVTLAETDKDDSEVVCGEGCNKTLDKCPEKSIKKVNHVPMWRSVLYVLFHITRLLLCVLLVAGFFLVFFLYDFKTFFVLYSFSMCCWIYKGRSYQFIEREQRKKIENVAFTGED